ncbi:hypothetical protein Nmel_012660, partial [Mimus melanotis]
MCFCWRGFLVVLLFFFFFPPAL